MGVCWDSVVPADRVVMAVRRVQEMVVIRVILMLVVERRGCVWEGCASHRCFVRLIHVPGECVHRKEYVGHHQQRRHQLPT